MLISAKFNVVQVVLFDTPLRKHLFPFTETRAVADILCGILTIRERWERWLGKKCHVLTEPYLGATTESWDNDRDYLYVNAHLFPEDALLEKIRTLAPQTALLDGETLLACRMSEPLTYPPEQQNFFAVHKLFTTEKYKLLDHPCRLFEWNQEMISYDFQLMTHNQQTAPISPTNRVSGEAQIFLEEGATVEHCFINATGGPVYIAQGCHVMEGSMLRGPCAILKGTIVKMGTTIYGATTLGPYCVAGGEIKNSIMMAYANKAHHGYLGDAVIGSWCNLGAGTSCSNIKNNASPVRIWNPWIHQWREAGLKCGVLMGDFSRTGINTSLNTGTVVGVSANIVSSHFSPKYIESFTWNVACGERYVLEKVFRDIDNWMKLKHQSLTSSLRNILSYLYNNPTKHEKTDRSS